jgi:hypothetical protein
MPDMLVRLYDLPDSAPHFERVKAAGYTVRRAEPWDRLTLGDFIRRTFNEFWAIEADRMFISTPITGFMAECRGEIAGFAAFECTRRNFFGPTGVRDDLRGSGLGSALLFASLHAMRELGYGYAIIGGVGEAEPFYETAVGAIAIPGSEIGVYSSLRAFTPAEGE